MKNLHRMGRQATYEQHYSALYQIDVRNVSDLKLEWYADMPTVDGLTGVPLVVDGVGYQSGALGKAWGTTPAPAGYSGSSTPTSVSPWDSFPRGVPSVSTSSQRGRP